MRLLRSGLKRASAASGDTNTLRARLAALASDAERLKALVELAQEDIAAVLALPGASSVPADVPLKELGLDSLMAVELRNRLSARVGTKLPTTVAFDYPTPTGDGAAAVGEAGVGWGSCSRGAQARGRCSDGGVGSHCDSGDELSCAERV